MNLLCQNRPASARGEMLGGSPIFSWLARRPRAEPVFHARRCAAAGLVILFRSLALRRVLVNGSPIPWPVSAEHRVTSGSRCRDSRPPNGNASAFPQTDFHLRRNENRHFTLYLQGCGDFHASKNGEPPIRTPDSQISIGSLLDTSEKPRQEHR